MRVTALLVPAIVVAAHAQGLPKPAQEAFDRAYRTLKAGQPQQALADYELALTLAPESWDIWLEYTAALRQTGQLQRAAEAGWRAVALGPAKPSSWINVGNVLISGGALGAAEPVLLEAVRLAPRDEGALRGLVNLGYDAWCQGDTALAERSFKRVLELAPEHLIAAIDMGAVALSLGRKEGETQVAAALARAKARGDQGAAGWAESVLKAGTALRAPYPRAWDVEEIPARLRAKPVSSAPSAPRRQYTLGRLPGLALTVPPAWVVKATQVDPALGAVTLTVTPREGAAFKILLTTFLNPKPKEPILPEGARATIENVLKSSGATLNWLTEPRGAMAWAQDPHWKAGTPDDYPFLLQALIQIGPAVVNVSAFWGDAATVPPPPADLLAFFASLSGPL